MIFYAHGGRALAGIEADLTRSDPVLAAQFERFNARYRRRPVEQRRQPCRRTRSVSKKPIAIVFLPLVVLLLSWYAVTGAGQGGGTGCATVAIATCPASLTSGWAPGAAAHRETAAHREMGPRASRIQIPPNVP